MREIFRKSGFFILGIFSLLYVIFARNFAEIHLQIPFLNFPIFVGEMILFICLILSFYVFNFYSIKGWQWAAVFCFVFVIAKAIWGYFIWGPLAFRHAALFYYPIFIFFGFIFYKKEFLTERLKISISFLILALCITGYFYSYWVLSLWVIAFILMRSFRHKAIKFFFYTALLSVIAFSFKSIILTSRTFIVGNLTALIFLTITLLLIAKIKVFYKAAITGSILILLAILILKHSSINESGTIFDIKNTVNLFRASDSEIKIRKLDYVPKNLKEIKLFNPEQPFSVSPAVTDKPQVKTLKNTEEAVKK